MTVKPVNPDPADSAGRRGRADTLSSARRIGSGNARIHRRDRASPCTTFEALQYRFRPLRLRARHTRPAVVAAPSLSTPDFLHRARGSCRNLACAQWKTRYSGVAGEHRRSNSLPPQPTVSSLTHSRGSRRPAPRSRARPSVNPGIVTRKQLSATSRISIYTVPDKRPPCHLPGMVHLMHVVPEGIPGSLFKAGLHAAIVPTLSAHPGDRCVPYLPAS